MTDREAGPSPPSTTAVSHPLISPATLAKLEQLQLRSRDRLIGRFAGEHNSTRYGESLDFADFRQYHPGDDFRRIDYHVLARLDHLLIKLFEADDSITVRLLVDTSGSMATGNKLQQARQLAAMVAFMSLIGHDTVTVHTMPRFHAPRRFNGRAAFPLLERHLQGLRAAGPTPFAQAASELMGRAGLRGITVVLSDLLTSDWDSLVRLRADRSALIVLQILDASDRALTFDGDVDLVDRESGHRVPLSTFEGLSRQYEADVISFLDRIARRCRMMGASHLVVDADTDPERLVLSTIRSMAAGAGTGIGPPAGRGGR